MAPKSSKRLLVNYLKFEKKKVKIFDLFLCNRHENVMVIVIIIIKKIDIIKWMKKRQLRRNKNKFKRVSLAFCRY